MTRIFFERTEYSYLPEISGYIQYLTKHFPQVEAFDSAKIPKWNPMDFDIVWRFMGIDYTGLGKFIVHEYNSLSTGIFPRTKNFIKKVMNIRPHRRVFLNEKVQGEFNFKDGVSARLREMGIDDRFFNVEHAPEYDFIYSGSFNRGSETEKLLNHFACILQDATLLVVGDVNPDLRDRYKQTPNIIFTGRVAYGEVPSLLAKARYGLNLIPDHYPYNLQTATKVLEYCAARLSIVSLRYNWIDKFAKDRQASIFWLTPDFKNLTWNNIKNFQFNTPGVDDLRWDNIISSSRIFDFLA